MIKGRVDEAREIFNVKQPQNCSSQEFETKKKLFNEDAGWVYMFKKLEFDRAVDNFKYTDVDPREFICMIKDLYSSSNQIKQFVREP